MSIRSACLLALLGIALPVPADASEGEPEYLSPVALEVSPDGSFLHVLCEDAGVMLAVHERSGEVRGRLAVGRLPRGLSRSADGRRLWVSVWEENVVVEVAAGVGGELALRRRIPTGFGPRGVAPGPAEKTLYVVNERANNISVIDLESGQERARLLAGNRPQEAAVSADGSRLYVSSLLSLPAAYRSPPKIELTEVDLETRRVVTRHIFEGGNLARGVAVSPDGGIVLVAMTRPKNLVPLTQLAQGWGVANVLGIVVRNQDRRPVVAQLGIDQPQRFFPDPRAVAFSPDGSLAFVTSSGCDTVTVVDPSALRDLVASASPEETAEHADNLGMYRRFVVGRVAVGSNPSALAVSPDGRRLYVADRLSDAISVIDLENREGGKLDVTRTIELNPGVRETLVRRGQRLFHDARVSFQQQLSCASCHPDHHIDGLTYDLEPDGVGREPLDNRTLLGLRGTAPFKWSGKNPDLATQDGPRAAKIIFRSVGFGARDVVAVTSFIRSLPVSANPHPSRDGRLTEAQARGKAIFEREVDNLGNPIEPGNRCVTCHPPPLFTNRQKFNVDTRGPLDPRGEFDTPHLKNVWESAPYLHDGRAATLEEIWTVYGNSDRHGIVGDLSKAELNDLIEYLKSL